MSSSKFFATFAFFLSFIYLKFTILFIDSFIDFSRAAILAEEASFISGMFLYFVSVFASVIDLTTESYLFYDWMDDAMVDSYFPSSTHASSTIDLLILTLSASFGMTAYMRDVEYRLLHSLCSSRIWCIAF